MEYGEKPYWIRKKYYSIRVVVATTKVRIFKQITTHIPLGLRIIVLLLLPQRYTFQANHNGLFNIS